MKSGSCSGARWPTCRGRASVCNRKEDITPRRQNFIQEHAQGPKRQPGAHVSGIGGIQREGVWGGLIKTHHMSIQNSQIIHFMLKIGDKNIFKVTLILNLKKKSPLRLNTHLYSPNQGEWGWKATPSLGPALIQWHPVSQGNTSGPWLKNTLTWNTSLFEEKCVCECVCLYH